MGCLFSIVQDWEIDAYEVKNQELMTEDTGLKTLLRSTQVIATVLIMLVRVVFCKCGFILMFFRLIKKTRLIHHTSHEGSSSFLENVSITWDNSELLVKYSIGAWV